MVLRLDDTDVERNSDASVQSIFDGLRWLGLSWDEEYKQSERLALHRQLAESIFAKGLAYRDFTPAHAGESDQSGAEGAWLFNPGMRDLLARRERPPRRRRRTLRPPLPRAARPRPHPALCRLPSTASRPSWPTRSKTSPCCAATACRPIIWPPAPTTPTCASATSFAARIISPTPTSTCSSLRRCVRHRSRRPAVRAPSAAGRSRRHQAFQAPPRTGRQRHHLSRRGLSAGGLRQLPLPARLVAQERSRLPHPAGADLGLHPRGRQSRQRRRQLHRRRSLRSQGRLAQRRAHPRPAGRAAFRAPAVCRIFCSRHGLHRDVARKRHAEKLLQVTPLIRERISFLRDVSHRRRLLFRRAASAV